MNKKGKLVFVILFLVGFVLVVGVISGKINVRDENVRFMMVQDDAFSRAVGQDLGKIICDDDGYCSVWEFDLFVEFGECEDDCACNSDEICQWNENEYGGCSDCGCDNDGVCEEERYEDEENCGFDCGCPTPPDHPEYEFSCCEWDCYGQQNEPNFNINLCLIECQLAHGCQGIGDPIKCIDCCAGAHEECLNNGGQDCHLRLQSCIYACESDVA